MHAQVHVPPLRRDALLAMLRVPSHTLVRRNGGFSPLGPERTTTSGACTVLQFTKRLVLMLDRDGLVTLDDPDFPETCTLNPDGKHLAEQLDAGVRGKAVRA